MRTGFRRLAWWRWVLAVVCVGFAGVWIVGEFRWLDLIEDIGPRSSVHYPSASIVRGRMVLGMNWDDPNDWQLKSSLARYNSNSARWWCTWERWKSSSPMWPGGWTLTIPLWFPGLLLFSLTALSWRRAIRERRRLAMTHCVQCGYDRRGLAESAVCPECGAKDDSRRHAEARREGGAEGRAGERR